MAKILTPEQVKARFASNGETIVGWAKKHGYPPIAVYQVLGGFRKGCRGQAHQIAVDLRLKADPERLAS